MNSVLVAVLEDRIQAEEAYLALEKANIPVQQISILGRGYKSADEYGLVDPNQRAKVQISLLAYWVVPFGFAAGFGFSLLSGLQTFSWAGEWGNHILGGLAGALAALLGSSFVGGGVGLSLGSGDALRYRNRLNAGQYLVIVQGSDDQAERAAPVLRRFNPESLQGYAEPFVNETIRPR